MSTEIKSIVSDKENAHFWDSAEKQAIDEQLTLLQKPEEFLENYEKLTGAISQFRSCVDWLAARGLPLRGNIIDVAAGFCWLPAYCRQQRLTNPDDTRFCCIDMASYRLRIHAPRILAAYGAENVLRVRADFYHLPYPEHYFDYAVLVEAFHHAGRPQVLLQELQRVLKPGAVVIISGEFRTTCIRRELYSTFRYWQWRCGLGMYEFMPEVICEQYGDHAYTSHQHRYLYEQQGFSILKKLRGDKMDNYILRRR